MSADEDVIEKLDNIDATISRLNQTLKEYLPRILASLEKMQVVP